MIRNIHNSKAEEVGSPLKKNQTFPRKSAVLFGSWCLCVCVEMVQVALQHVETGFYLHGAVPERGRFFNDDSVSCRHLPQQPAGASGFVMHYQWGILSFPLLSTQTNVVRAFVSSSPC